MILDRRDDLARTLDELRPRRGLVAALLAAPAMLRLLPPSDAAGKKRKNRKKRCKQSEKKCGKKCVKGVCCPEKSCGGTDECICVRSIAGKTFCAENIIVICEPCLTNADCGSGRQCLAEPGLGGCCFPECGAI